MWASLCRSFASANPPTIAMATAALSPAAPAAVHAIGVPPDSASCAAGAELPDAALSAAPTVRPKEPRDLLYDRGAAGLRAGVAHFGVGGFFRAHQAVYLDELLERGEASEWCYVGVGALPSDAAMRDYINAGDGLYPVVSRQGDHEELRVVGSVLGMVLAPEDPHAAVETLASDDIKIVSLTVTEFGYRVPFSDHDAALARAVLAGEAPPPGQASVWGYVVAGLASRMRAGRRPFTVLSCDNLPHNGKVARDAVLKGCAAVDAGLRAWVEAECRFPCTMVDRITPATTPADVASLRDAHGLDDAWPVVCEQFKQWVVEDDFVDGKRPPWEHVGVLMVDDVAPYELLKIRLLNVVHSVMCYPALLMGFSHVHDAANDPLVRRFLDAVMLHEIREPLNAIESVQQLLPELSAYQEKLLERFGNVAVKDQLMRIAMDMTEKFNVQGKPLVMDGLAYGKSMRGLALAIAAWAHFIERQAAMGEPLRDPGADAVTAAMASPRGLDALLDLPGVFGELAGHAGWRAAVREGYDAISAGGVDVAVRMYCDGVDGADAPQAAEESA